MTARAEDGTSTNIVGPAVVGHGSGDYYVGNTGTNNILTISGGGMLTNVANG